VGGNGGCGVLQHRRGKRVRKLQEIVGIGSSGRSSPGSGGRRRCSTGIHEGEWTAGGWRRRSRCGERWGGSGAREEGSERSGDVRTSGAARAGSERHDDSAAKGKRGAKRWGSGRGGATWCGGAVGPSPDQRTVPDSGPSVALAGDVRRARACRLTERGREGADGWATDSAGRRCH
jgi:hypothetical protein